ncbi:MAG TPA: DNA-deoxyinosine glycosylase [Stenotrophomonas sp.]
MSKNVTLIGLDAQIPVDCRVLVLGSMPGAASLQAGRYYAHPRNRFWPLASALLGIEPALDYPARLAALQARGVGLWDVIGRCARPGSLDASIRRASIVANPLPQLLPALPGLRVVACNGAEAHRAWRRYVAPALTPALQGLPILSLPSTSPANAAWSLPRLCEAWSVIVPYLDSGAI